MQLFPEASGPSQQAGWFGNRPPCCSRVGLIPPTGTAWTLLGQIVPYDEALDLDARYGGLLHGEPEAVERAWNA
ncbi:hypothetical protein GCM10009760_00020 [Kitasatospora kazusensis]|uniref:Uncharacterized protein n=1 Tax=Kitasatospora kazusensis TaxID=407974 RepID=A0ABN2YMK7_9ACTN